MDATQSIINSYLNHKLQKFIKKYKDGLVQRSDEWLAAKRNSIGGSEIAALMGMNPYSSFNDIVMAKAGLSTFAGNAACSWGTMFEPTIERVVEIDLNTTLYGTEISIPAPKESGLEGKHANSPDGFGVVSFNISNGSSNNGSLEICSSLAGQTAESPKQAIVLFEFKCPYRRQPKDNTPDHYLPQVWSGLALSDVAEFGIFVDAVFRRCCLSDLGLSTNYYKNCPKRKIERGLPIAWGINAVYAPAPGSAHLVSPIVREIYSNHFDINSAEFRTGQLGPIDFGGVNIETFEKILYHINARHFTLIRSDPCFVNGKGEKLNNSQQITSFICNLPEQKDKVLLGIIPWKLFEIRYQPIERRDDFLEVISPLINRCLDEAAIMRENPEKVQKNTTHSKYIDYAQIAIDQEQLQELFDLI